MAIKGYLAVTAAEFGNFSPMGADIAWMACHFSPYGTTLSNCPGKLPEGAMVILNDRTPICGHDPQGILEQLTALVENRKYSRILLDFQRSGAEETAALVRVLQKELPCPTAVSDLYAGDDDSPVFLPPVPLDVTPEDYLAPWQGREIWLEAALEGQELELTEKGINRFPLTDPPEDGHWEEALCCHYQIHVGNTAKFRLFRTADDLRALLHRAEALGATTAVGLYQELGDFSIA